MRKRGCSPVVAALAALLFALLPVEAPIAQPAAQPAAQPVAQPQVVLVATGSRSGQADAAFESVVYDALRVWLSRRGLLVSAASASGSASGAVQRAGGDRADLSLVALVGRQGDDVVLDIVWRDPRSGEAVASASTRGAADLDLDRVVYRAADSTWAAVEAFLKGLSPRDPGEPPPLLAAGPISEPKTAPPATEETIVAAGRLETGAPGQPAPRLRNGFQLLLSFSPFMPTGAAAELITLGYQPSVTADFLIGLPVGYLGLGLHTAVNYFQATGYLASSHSLLVPMALDVRLETVNDRVFRLFARLAGGAALMVLILDETMTKAVPYAAAGAGLEIPFRGRGGLKVGLNYQVYFERPYLIMGYSPEVGLFWRF